MKSEILSTKLFIPSHKPGCVSRARLVNQLNQGLTRKLTLLSAPAGFGKTTLLSEWVTSCDWRSAWISLDNGDNDPSRFWSYFIVALQTIKPDVGTSTIAKLRSPQPPPLDVILTALINDVVEVPDPFILVLDNYQFIENVRIHDALAFLLKNLSSKMHLVISTRIDPPLPIAWLRGQGQLTELRQSDLRFTNSEVSTFLNTCMDLDLSSDDISALQACTEGWIAGIQMAAVSMRGHENVTEFIRAFTGSDRNILDYLVEEVLLRQDKNIQTFLLQTSILDRLNGPLCDEILQADVEAQLDEEESDLSAAWVSAPSSSGQEILEYLERNNLFIVPLDNERCWYRYHHLFADLLRERLHRTQPYLVPSLHTRASTWYEQNGNLPVAIEHSLSAKNFERAASLIQRSAETTFMRGEFTTFLGWVDSLPTHFSQDWPLLHVYDTGIRLLDGLPLDIAEVRLQEVIAREQPKSVLGAVVTFQTLIAVYQGDTRKSIEMSQQALDLLSEENLFLRSLIAGFLGINYLWSGDSQTAVKALREAVHIGQQSGNLTITVLALCHLAELYMIRGQLRKAREHYERAIDLAVDSEGCPLPIAGIAFVGLGYLVREWNDLEAAQELIIEGIELTKKWEEMGPLTGYISLACVKQTQGEEEAARTLIQEAGRLAKGFEGIQIIAVIASVFQARLWNQQGDIKSVLNWAEDQRLQQRIEAGELEKGSHSLPFIYGAMEYMAYTEALIANDQPKAALDILKPLIQLTEAGGWMMFTIESLALESLAYQALGDADRAMASLNRALSQAEKEEFVRLFLDKGQAMERMLHKAVKRGVSTEYIHRLLDVSPTVASVKEMEPIPAPVGSLGVLTERETELLGYLNTHLSAPEIAEELYISVNTVRFHIKNIYSKLNVHNRADAVHRAEELDLL